MTKLQRLRDRAVRMFLAKADAVVPMLIDYQIDTCLRNMFKLPERPDGQPPYEGWLVDRTNEVVTERGISAKGLAFIKRWEGCRWKAYLCPANVWTIGYGHTKTAKPGQVITQEQADELLREDVRVYETAVRKSVRVPLNQNQFDALASFCFNVGIGAFYESSLLRLLNTEDYNSVSIQMKRWVRGGGKVLPGLVKRREAESLLFREK